MDSDGEDSDNAGHLVLRAAGPSPEGIRFGDAVRELCEPYCQMDRSRGGRPGIHPEVYFKRKMLGFFEGLTSDRGMAMRCAGPPIDPAFSALRASRSDAGPLESDGDSEAAGAGGLR